MPMRRLFLVALALLVLTGCDRYIEQVTIEDDGSVSVAVEAEIICTDEDAIELWGGDPCGFLDDLGETGKASPGPLGLASLALGPEISSFEVEGQGGRRSVRADWSIGADELETLVAGPGSIEAIDEISTRATFSSNDLVRPQLTEPRPGRWTAGEFRIVVPERVVDHNGDRVVERTVIWLIDEDLPEEFTVAWGVEDRGLPVWWLVVGTVILGVVLAMIVLIEGPRAEAARAEARASADAS